MTERILHSFYAMLIEPAPPSSNHLYRRGFAGRMVLSKEGQAFKGALAAEVVRATSLLPWKDALEDVYHRAARVRVLTALHSEEVLNSSWKPGRKTKTGNIVSPFKKWDGPNYAKAIDDAIAEGTGIDDSAHFDSRILKVPDTSSYTEVWYEIYQEVP